MDAEIFIIGVSSVFVGLLVVVGIVLAVRAHGRLVAWRKSLSALAEKLAISHKTHNGPVHDIAEGCVGESPVHISNVDKRMRLQVVTPKVDEAMVLKQAGAKVTVNLEDEDWEADAGTATQVGDAEFDQRFDLRGASPVLLQALTTKPELRELIMRVVGESGGYLVSSSLYMVAPLPKSKEEILSYLKPMLELARWLDAPLAPQSIADPTAPTTGSLKRRLRHVPRERRMPEYKRFLEGVLTPVGAGQAYLSEDPRQLDWRGTSHGFALRVLIKRLTEVELTVKLNNQHGPIQLFWDASKIPAVGTPEAWDESETVTVFVDMGVFMTGDAQQTDMALQRFRALPAEITSAITEGMRRDDVTRFELSDDAVELEVRPTLFDMHDPEGQMTRLAQLVGWIAQQLEATLPDASMAPVGQPSAGPAVEKKTCSYCRTLYLWGPQPNCPNCGAPAQG